MNFTLGLLMGFHFINTDLYNVHPSLEVNNHFLIYENSFEKLSIAAYEKYEFNNFKLRVGLTTGYSSIIKYKNRNYEVKTANSEGIGLFVVPSYEKGNFIAAILGDAINLGVKYDF